jgi:hypothetical protein
MKLIGIRRKKCSTHKFHLLGGFHTFVLNARATDNVFPVAFNIIIDEDV